MGVEIKSLYKKKIKNFKKDKWDKVIVILGYVLETFFNSLLPFIYGFYFVHMKNIFFLFAFFIHLIFYFRIKHDKDNFEISFIRRL